MRSDNVGALSVFSPLRGKGAAMGLIAREYAIDVGNGAYTPDLIDHIPGVANVTADVLSRRYARARQKDGQFLRLYCTFLSR